MQTQDFTKLAGVEQMETAVKASKETFEKAMKASKQNADKAYEAGADAVAKSVDGMFAAAKEQVEKAFPQAAPRFDELAELNKGNLDAFLAAGAIAKKGMETMADEFAAYNQEAVEESIAGMKAMMGVKTFQDWIEFQTRRIELRCLPQRCKRQRFQRRRLREPLFPIRWAGPQ